MAGVSSPFRPFLEAKGVCVMDGGLTTALPKGCEKHYLWGSQLLFGYDGGLGALKATHRRFLENGADYIGTLTYKLSEELVQSALGVEAARSAGDSGELGPGEPLEKQLRAVPVAELFRRAIGAAKEARDEFWAENPHRIRPLVFACCGPLGDQFLFQGATDPNCWESFSGRYSGDALAAYYERKLRAIAACSPDGVAIETLPGAAEADVALRVFLALPPGLDHCLISFMARDDQSTISGDTIEKCIDAVLARVDAADSVAAARKTVAIGVNCFDPRHAEPLLERMRAHLEGRTCLLAAYPNSGESWDSARGRRCWHQEGSMKYLTGEDAVSYWKHGAQLVGGCCRVFPEQIKLFREALHGVCGAAAVPRSKL